VRDFEFPNPTPRPRAGVATMQSNRSAQLRNYLDRLSTDVPWTGVPDFAVMDRVGASTGVFPSLASPSNNSKMKDRSP
jgi:hypothetical protein